MSAQKLMEAFEEQTIEDLYRAKVGAQGMQRFKEVAQKAKAGNMTYRQAASTLGISYYEFVSLLQETDATDA